MYCNCYNCGCEMHLKLIDVTKQPKPEDIFCSVKCLKENEAKKEK